MNRLIDLILVAAVVMLAVVVISECSDHRINGDADAHVSFPSTHRSIGGVPSTVEARPVR